MDKKEYKEALKLIGQDKCRATLQGLLELKGDTPFETAEKIRKYVAGYDKAEVAADNLIEILQFATASGCPVGSVEPAFARGLEYYTGMIFEVNVPELDVALGGGGRYDRLIEVFGGESTPAVGVAHGLDRIALAMQVQKIALPTQREKTAVVLPVKPKLKKEALKLSQMLRDAGVSVEFEVMGRKMAKALEDADKRKVDYAIIVGERELKEGAVTLRDLAKHKQITVEIAKLLEIIKG